MAHRLAKLAAWSIATPGLHEAKRETPVSATSTPKSIEPFDGSAERERLAHAYQQIRRADEELTRLSEQVAKMQRASERPPSAGRERRSAPGRWALRALVGLP